MKTTALHGMALAGLAPLALVSTALAAGPLIVVTGSGSAEMQPDRVTIEFTVVNRARSAAEASTANAQRTRPILDAANRVHVRQTVLGGRSVWHSGSASRLS